MLKGIYPLIVTSITCVSHEVSPVYGEMALRILFCDENLLSPLNWFYFLSLIFPKIFFTFKAVCAADLVIPCMNAFPQRSIYIYVQLCTYTYVLYFVKNLPKSNKTSLKLNSPAVNILMTNPPWPWPRDDDCRLITVVWWAFNALTKWRNPI